MRGSPERPLLRVGSCENATRKVLISNPFGRAIRSDVSDVPDAT
jgi:hypothetical protein